MRTPLPAQQDHSIVLIGNFNPKIFQPAWFGAEGLIAKEETKDAKIEIIHSDIVIFSLDWLRLEVTQERFMALSTLESHVEILRDLAIETFRLLRHTPITKMGINRRIHFRIDSEEKWHKTGDILAPKGVWSGILNTPGLTSMTMQGARVDENLGFIRVKVEPSTKFHPGLYFDVNDHYSVKDIDSTVGCEEIINILEKKCASSYKESEILIYNLYDKLLEKVT